MVFAADSLGGRRAGSPGGVLASAYIERELRRIGAVPAGESGSFFQSVPLQTRLMPDSATHISVAGQRLIAGSQFLPRDNGPRTRSLVDAEVVFAGTWGDTVPLLESAAAAGKVVVVAVRPGEFAVSRPTLQQRYDSAAGICVANLHALSIPARELMATAPVSERDSINAPLLPAFFHVTESIAAEIFGAPTGTLRPGAPGARISGAIRFAPRTTYGRNVIAVIPGSDPELRGQYVAVGSHLDHEGVGAAVDPDSLRAVNLILRRAILAESDPPPDLEEIVRRQLDSIRAINPAPRRDSIYNGADDDGSGVVAMLEIARALIGSGQRRSILLVWHDAEESGLIGSSWFVEHPTVPRDSIMAYINLDMVGRGGAGDEVGGGPHYLQSIGARRRSSQLGDLLETVSRERNHHWRFDYSFDEPGHSEQLFCRSDHFNYARFGIPVAFLTTGTHADYHQVTDEVDQIDFEKLARVSTYVRDVLQRLANLPEALALDKPAPDPGAPCVM